MFNKFSTLSYRKQLILMGVTLILITLVLYYPSLSYDFLYELDDDWIVVSNNSIKIPSIYGWKTGLAYLFFMDTNDFHYHPVTYVSLSIDYYFFGMNAYVIKMHNLILHIVSGVLLFGFINLLVKNKWIAFVVALFFLIHPMNIESVAWASCRRQSLFVCYFILAMITYKLMLGQQIKKYRVILYFLTVLFWIISTLAKASAIVLPFLFILINYHHYRTAFRIKSVTKHIIPLLPFLLFFVYVNGLANDRNFLTREFSYSGFQHIVFAGYTYSFYWIKALFPFPLVHFYPAPSELLPHLPAIYYCLFAGCLGLSGLLIYHFYKKHYSLFFALCFYTITILPMLNLMYYPLGDLPMLVSNRYFYHSSIGILLYIVLLIKYLPYNLKLKKVVFAALFALYFILFKIHIPVWKNQFTVLENTAKYYPSEDILYKLAFIYDDAGDTETALINLEKADKLGTKIWINYLWSYYQKRSRLYVKATEYEKALKDINLALQKKKYKTKEDDSILVLDKKIILNLIQNNTSVKK